MSTTPPLPPEQPFIPLPPAPAAAAPVVAAPPPDKVAGGSVVKIILIIVGVFVFLGVLAAAVVGYGFYKVSHAVSQAVKVDKNGGVTLNTPGGTFSTSGSGVSTISVADLGVDLYPGAVRGEGSMNLKTPQGSMVTAVYTTGDSIAQVVEFYKSKLGENVSTVETGNGTMLTSADNKANNSLLVTVTTDDGKTKITIVHTTKKEVAN